MNFEAKLYFIVTVSLAIVPETLNWRGETLMIKSSTILAAFAVVAASAISLPALQAATPSETSINEDGIIKVKSAFGFGETIARLKADIEKKGIKFFLAVDQSDLGAAAGIKLKPSTLLIFGNPPLGIQFLTSNPDSGLDWPVRLLVRQDGNAQVWAVYTDFGWIAKRHGITDREAQFKMASEVIASITSSIASKHQ